LCITTKLAADGRDGSKSVIAVVSAAGPLFHQERHSSARIERPFRANNGHLPDDAGILAGLDLLL
jgi:hypothetical protein